MFTASPLNNAKSNESLRVFHSVRDFVPFRQDGWSASYEPWNVLTDEFIQKEAALVKHYERLNHIVHTLLRELSDLTPNGSIKVGSKLRLQQTLHLQVEKEYDLAAVYDMVEEALPNYPKLRFD